jgi:hypothetical protein
VFVLLPIVLAAVLSADSRIGPRGVGPIVFGMTPEQAAATGMDLVPYGSPEPGSSCYFVRPENLPGVDFMVEDGTLRRVDERAGNMRTVDGFRIGDDAGDVMKFYGHRAAIAPDKYDPHAQTIDVTPEGADADKYRTIFKVKDKEVYEIVAGALPQVEYVERCG